MTDHQPPGGQPPLTHVLITGASAGIGLELARLFATDGNPLILVARRLDRLQALADTLRRDHEVEVRVIALDLTAPEACAELVDELASQKLGVRVLVNNAGLGSYGPFVNHEASAHQKLIDLNISALTSLTRMLLPAMVVGAAAASLKPGVMNVGSTAAFQPGPLMAVYFASKSYVLSFSEALHEELRDGGVTISAFCPGPTRSEFFATEQMIPPEAFDDNGDLKDSARAEFERRDAKRMDTATAARIGYAGFKSGQAVVIPGLMNQIMAQSSRFAPRALVRRLVKRMMSRNWE